MISDQTFLSSSVKLRLVDMEGPGEASRQPEDIGPVVDTYDYTNEDGEPLFQVCSDDNAPGGEAWKLGDVRRPPFRLPELHEAVALGRRIYVVEGEKAVLALHARGRAATCNPGGAGKGAMELPGHVPGADVVVLADNDPPGRDHAGAIAAALHSAAASVRVLLLPGLLGKGDVVDWLDAGGTADQLDRLADAAPIYQPPAEEPDGSPSDDAEDPGLAASVDAGNSRAASELILLAKAPLMSAREFLDRCHTFEGLRTLHHQNGAFFTWRQSHYVETLPEEMRAELYLFLNRAWQVARNSTMEPFNPNKAKVANVVEAAGALAQLPQSSRPPSWLGVCDSPPAHELIACANGLLHLPTRTLHGHSPQFFTLNALDFDYQVNAPSPREWLAFLDSVWPDDAEAIATLQEVFGLLLTHETRHQKAFLIVGPKRSGKGTIARVVTKLLGAANVCGPTLSGLGTNFGLAPLVGKRLAIVSDARLSGRADQQVVVERLLSITGEDGLTIDRKFREAWTGKLDVRFLVMTNEMPRLTDSSGALAGRFVTLKMARSFYGKEDLGLGVRLVSELPGILKWAIDGWDRLSARGYFVPPASSLTAQQELEDLGSPTGAFLRDRCAVGPGHAVRVDDIYLAWCNWCHEQGRDHPGSKQSFGRDLGAAVAGLTLSQPRGDDGSRPRYYEGVSLDPGRG